MEMSSSAAAEALHSCMLHKQYDEAKEILAEDGHYDGTFEEAWEEVLAQYRATKMELVTITADQVRSLRETDTEYLVRIGRTVFIAWAMESRKGDELVLRHSTDSFALNEVDEIFEIRVS